MLRSVDFGPERYRRDSRTILDRLIFDGFARNTSSRNSSVERRRFVSLALVRGLRTEVCGRMDFISMVSDNHAGSQFCWRLVVLSEYAAPTGLGFLMDLVATNISPLAAC